MKFFSLLLVLVCFTWQGFSQRNHFIYIQTESRQPFYVKLPGKLLSSSSVGYMVIPKLQSGSYELNIGFPKNEWPMQKLVVQIGNKDVGYLLRQFDSRGWGFFNMQTMEVIMASNGSQLEVQKKEMLQDGFADILADVVNAPSIKEKTVPVMSKKEEEKITAEVKIIKDEIKEPVTVPVVQPLQEKKEAVITIIKEDAPAKSVVRLFSTSDATGSSYVYGVFNDAQTDTVRIFIPLNKSAVKKVQKTETPTETEPLKAVIKVVEKETEAPSETRFLDMELANPNSSNTNASTVKTTETIEEKKEQQNPPVSVMLNSDCRSNADENDFLKLRKKMAGEKNDAAMIEAAKKMFKSMCFNTEQVGNLSVLFLNDEGKYNFFDEAYPRVYDTHNFPQLSAQLSDPYYIARFHAMIRK